MTKQIKVKVNKFDSMRRGIVSYDPRLQLGELPASLSDVKEVLYDFFVDIELSDGEKAIALTIAPLIDARALRIIAWNWELDDFYFIQDGATNKEFDDDCLKRFFNRLPGHGDYWRLKEEIQDKIWEEINRGLPNYLKGIALTA